MTGGSSELVGPSATMVRRGEEKSLDWRRKKVTAAFVAGYPSDKEFMAVYANWNGRTCRGFFHPTRFHCVFGVGDLPLLVRRRELFANKFHVDKEPLAYDCLEAWLRHKETCPPPFDYGFYSNLTFANKRRSR